MKLSYYKSPGLFYLLSTAVPWLFWFTAAYLSHNTSMQPVTGRIGGALALLGLVSPMIIASVMMWRDPVLRHDLINRALRFNRVGLSYLLMTCFLMLGSILLAQAISLLFGHSLKQFTIAESTSFTFGLFPAWFLLFLAPLFEELAWHTYGTDCLRNRFNLFTTSILFGVFWAFWHLPLGFIKEYYHSNVVETGWLYTLNFAVSLIPFVLIMNWLYYKTDRNILVPVIFHITAGLFNELFMTHPDSKVIQTVLLLSLSVYLVCKDKPFFFNRHAGVDAA